MIGNVLKKLAGLTRKAPVKSIRYFDDLDKTVYDPLKNKTSNTFGQIRELSNSMTVQNPKGRRNKKRLDFLRHIGAGKPK